MPTLSKTTVTSSYKATMSDMQSELSPTERVWSRLLHSPTGALIGGFFGSLLFRPRSLMMGAAVSFVTLVGTYTIAHIYEVPFNATESLVAFAFGWCIGLLYDLFFVISRGRR
ncbi:MAG TPA: hypothetical protein PKD28_03015 [Candidatus Saccharibacteria bacterium]|nr:hypothetical protein [Candidatus Saccharibacteria bacterium]